MKKILFIIAMLFLVKVATAQSGMLTIHNNNQNCWVHVNVFARDANLFNSNCGIRTGTIILAPSTSFGPFNPASVYSTPGFLTMTPPFGLAALNADLTSLSPGFVWTDAEFQYVCPITDCGIGGRLSENFPGFCGGTCAIPAPGISWVNPVPLLCPSVIAATWISIGNCFMNDITLNF